jgi:hypothetical protein
MFVSNWKQSGVGSQASAKDESKGFCERSADGDPPKAPAGNCYRTDMRLSFKAILLSKRVQ